MFILMTCWHFCHKVEMTLMRQTSQKVSVSNFPEKPTQSEEKHLNHRKPLSLLCSGFWDSWKMSSLLSIFSGRFLYYCYYIFSLACNASGNPSNHKEYQLALHGLLFPSSMYSSRTISTKWFCTTHLLLCRLELYSKSSRLKKLESKCSPGDFDPVAGVLRVGGDTSILCCGNLN
jgi:hypothetical protein